MRTTALSKRYAPKQRCNPKGRRDPKLRCHTNLPPIAKLRCHPKQRCHPERSEGSAVAFAFAISKSPNELGPASNDTGFTTPGRTRLSVCPVTGHDFSRVELSAKYKRALARDEPRTLLAEAQ
jgi:hypothetical protein